jgi:hypothetical protein
MDRVRGLPGVARVLRTDSGDQLAISTGDARVGGGPDPAGGTGLGGSDELLYASERTRVTRIRFRDGGDGAVIRKEPLGPGAAQRLRHELAMLRRLAGVDGIPQLAADPDPAALTLVDQAGMSLAAVIAADRWRRRSCCRWGGTSPASSPACTAAA